jgi:nucleoside 2-deoxyribosyltransferase/predicted secreted protein
MYVLCSPCVLNPALRADGITSQEDLGIFRNARQRCEQFGIEMVPLPCPETLYLGPDRKPGTFLERLNTREFFDVLDQLTSSVEKIIDQRGSPLLLLGVNSSPTCGVTSTYYGSTNGEPPKRAGRGVFLDRFPGIRAMDVAAFSRYRIYLAAPLFSEAERTYNAKIAGMLTASFFSVFVPQDAGDDSATRSENENARIFSGNTNALENSDIVVAIIDGPDADSGTAWEMGYAYGIGKPVIALRTDFRRAGEHEHVNLMLERSAIVVSGSRELLEAVGSPGHIRTDR